jgi:thiol-disulfide isomerase/thioredoxin
MKSLKAIVIYGITIALAILIYGASGRSPARSSPPSIAAINKDKSATGTAPEFELKTLDGRAVKLSDFRGKAVVLNFWATYCGPCRVEMPWLIDLDQQYRSGGLEIIGVSMDDDLILNN